MTVIYLDSVFVLNALMDYILLLSCARLTGIGLRRGRYLAAAVFGGIGSIPGAMIGGVLLGLIETFTKAYITTDLSDAIVFAVLIVVLLVKPSGLLGKYVPEKV